MAIPKMSHLFVFQKILHMYNNEDWIDLTADIYLNDNIHLLCATNFMPLITKPQSNQLIIS